MSDQPQLVSDTPIRSGPPPMSATLAFKLLSVMNAIEAVPKAGHNKDQNYDYVRAGDISAATRRAMFDNHVLLLWNPVGLEWREFKTASGKDAREATAWYEATFHDCDTGEEYTLRWPGLAMDLQDKALAKAATAALKSFLVTQFQIPDEDPDSEAGASRARAGLASPVKVDGVITTAEAKGRGAALTVKYGDQTARVWAGPAFAEKLLAAKGKSVSLSALKKQNDQGEYLDVVRILAGAEPTGGNPVTKTTTPAPPIPGAAASPRELFTKGR